MRRYLLVFDDGNGADLDLRGYVDGLDSDAEMFALDGHVCFLKSELSASELADKFLRRAGSRLFFITELNSLNSMGRLPGVLWDFLKEGSEKKAMESAAE
jgi:hypothetical protein